MVAPSVITKATRIGRPAGGVRALAGAASKQQQASSSSEAKRPRVIARSLSVASAGRSASPVRASTTAEPLSRPLPAAPPFPAAEGPFAAATGTRESRCGYLELHRYRICWITGDAHDHDPTAAHAGTRHRRGASPPRARGV